MAGGSGEAAAEGSRRRLGMATSAGGSAGRREKEGSKQRRAGGAMRPRENRQRPGERRELGARGRCSRPSPKTQDKHARRKITLTCRNIGYAGCQ